MGHTRVRAIAAAMAAALLVVPAVAGCTSASSPLRGSSGHPVDPVAAASDGPSGGSAPATPEAQALSTALSAALSSAATRAASVAATAARSAAKSAAGSAARTTHPVSPSTSRPATRAPAPPTRASSAPVVSGDSSIESEIFSMINQERADNGLPALQLSGALTVSARRHSAAMAADQTMSHQLPGEAGLPEREAAAGYRGSGWAENVGMTPQGNESGAVSLQDLMYSDPPHRANILATSMRAVGVGVVIDSRGQLWLTEDFGG